MRRMLRTLALAADQEDGLGAIEAFTRADRAFHARVAQLSDNAVLADFASLLHDRCMRFWYLHLWQTLDTKGTAREHLAISDAIAAGDGDAAAAAMRAHIVTLKERVSRIPACGADTAVRASYIALTVWPTPQGRLSTGLAPPVAPLPPPRYHG